MLIWTWQEGACADTLEAGLPWRCDCSLSSWRGDFDYCYDWMAARMCERIGEPPEGVRWPVWGWARYDFVDGGCPKDDDEMVDPHAEGDYVRILADIPDEFVLLSDEDGWSSALMGYPVEPYEFSLIEDERELHDRIDALLDMKEDIDADVPTDEILATWERVFDVRRARSGIGAWHGRNVQATFWELRPEWVVVMQRFHVVPHASAWDVDIEVARHAQLHDGGQPAGALR